MIAPALPGTRHQANATVPTRTTHVDNLKIPSVMYSEWQSAATPAASAAPPAPGHLLPLASVLSSVPRGCQLVGFLPVPRQHIPLLPLPAYSTFQRHDDGDAHCKATQSSYVEYHCCCDLIPSKTHRDCRLKASIRSSTSDNCLVWWLGLGTEGHSSSQALTTCKTERSSSSCLQQQKYELPGCLVHKHKQ